MKKVVCIFLLSFFLLLFSLSFLSLKDEYDKRKESNNNLIKEINVVKKDIEIKINNNKDYEEEKTSLENSNKEKIEEKNIWERLKLKLKQALS